MIAEVFEVEGWRRARSPEATPGFRPVGIARYREVLTSPVFWTVVVNMTLWAAITVPVQMLIGGTIAYFIERHTIRLRGFFRTAFFLPVVTSVSIIALVGVQIYAPYYGIAQQYLKNVGLTLTFSPIGDPSTAIFALIVVNIWQWTGFSMLMYVAGIANLPGYTSTPRRSTAPAAWPSRCTSSSRCWLR